MPSVIHFEIFADEPERAVKFYTEVFGWQIQSRGGPVDYRLATTGPDTEPGINSAIAAAAKERGLQATLGTILASTSKEY